MLDKGLRPPLHNLPLVSFSATRLRHTTISSCCCPTETRWHRYRKTPQWRRDCLITNWSIHTRECKSKTWSWPRPAGGCRCAPTRRAYRPGTWCGTAGLGLRTALSMEESFVIYSSSLDLFVSTRICETPGWRPRRTRRSGRGSSTKVTQFLCPDQRTHFIRLPPLPTWGACRARPCRPRTGPVSQNPRVFALQQPPVGSARSVSCDRF